MIKVRQISSWMLSVARTFCRPRMQSLTFPPRFKRWVVAQGIRGGPVSGDTASPCLRIGEAALITRSEKRPFPTRRGNRPRSSVTRLGCTPCIPEFPIHVMLECPGTASKVAPIAARGPKVLGILRCSTSFMVHVVHIRRCVMGRYCQEGPCCDNRQSICYPVD
jgi:hypothetical protein